jgi:sugar phosphate isomerase/epimerase
MGHYVFGLNNCWALKRFSEPEVWVEIAATKMDVDVVQFSFDLLDPIVGAEASADYIARTKDACRKYGVKVQSCSTGGAAYMSNFLLHPFPRFREFASDWYAKAVRLSRMLGAETMGGHFGALTVKDSTDPQRRQALISEMVDRVIELSRIGQESGLGALLWEPMPVSREPPSTIAEAQTLLARLEKRSLIPIRLCIDVGHACNRNATDPRDQDPYEWLSKLGAASLCIHLQQTDGKADRHWPFTEEYNKVGLIDGKRVILSLDKGGAKDTYLYLEAFPAFEQKDDQVIVELLDSVKYWKQVLN